MGFDSMNFVLNYPVGSAIQVSDTSASYTPSSVGMLKISFYDGTFLGAESEAFVLTRDGIKGVLELKPGEYLGLFYPSSILGNFKEHVQFQTIRNFLINEISIEKQIISVEPMHAGYGTPNPILLNADNGGLQQSDTPCMCVLFSDTCGTRVTTAIINVSLSEN